MIINKLNTNCDDCETDFGNPPFYLIFLLMLYLCEIFTILLLFFLSLILLSAIHFEMAQTPTFKFIEEHWLCSIFGKMISPMFYLQISHT